MHVGRVPRVSCFSMRLQAGSRIWKLAGWCASRDGLRRNYPRHETSTYVMLNHFRALCSSAIDLALVHLKTRLKYTTYVTVSDHGRHVLPSLARQKENMKSLSNLLNNGKANAVKNLVTR